MQIHNNTLIAECSSYDFKEMLERKKVKSWLKSVSAFANTDGGSLFYGVNDEGSEKKFGVNAEKFGVNEKSSEERFGVTNNASMKKFGVKGEEASKRVSRTGQKIIDLVISDPSITAEAMSVKIGVSKRAVEKNIKELRERGILVHEGSDKAGYWRIIVKPS